MRGLGHDGPRLVVGVQRQQHGLGARDRAEHGQHEVREAVAVAVERRDHERPVRRAGDQPRVGGVDQHGGVGDVRVALRRGVHLLLEHPLVDGAHGPLGPAVHAAVGSRGRAEAVLGHGAADAARDALGAPGVLVAVDLLATLLRAVGVPHGHPDHGDRVVHARHGRDARDPPAGADDHLAVELLAQDPVGAAHVVLALGRDGGRLQAQPRLADGGGRLLDDLRSRSGAATPARGRSGRGARRPR